MAQSELKAPDQALNVDEIRRNFPGLAAEVHGKPLIYFDNAATAQRPNQVIDACDRFYREYNANIHRGVHTMSERATTAFEAAREKIRAHINARSNSELVFVRGSTEAVNLVAASFGRANIGSGDEIVISHMEHHSNIVPWQLLAEQVGAKIRVAPINRSGELRLNALEALLNERTKMVAVVHVSNALGTINPIKKVVEMAHARDIPVLVDGAQAMPHLAVDVQELDCDFYTISGHKMYGPTGIGVLYGKEALLEAMPPYHGGGEMISHVSFDKTIYAQLPAKFEAGTPNIAGAIGLGAVVDYLNSIGMQRITAYEQELLEHIQRATADIEGFRAIGTAREKAAVLSFVLDGVHPHDLGTVVDHSGVAIRTGHHCTMPLMQFFEVPGTARASLAFYNTSDEIDEFCDAVKRAKALFAA